MVKDTKQDVVRNTAVTEEFVRFLVEGQSQEALNRLRTRLGIRVHSATGQDRRC